MNIVTSLSKPIDHIMMEQILEYMLDNNLIDSNHHGNMKHKSTQTLVTEIVDFLTEKYEEGADTAVIGLDQSKAYDIICHLILKEKAKIIGFSESAKKYLIHIYQTKVNM